MCSLFTCFAFICVFSASLCSVLSRSSCPFGVVFYSYGTFATVFSGLCSLFSFPVYFLGHSLLGFTLFCFCFSVLSVVSGVSVLRLLSFLWGFSSPFQVPHLFFGVSFTFVVVFPSLQFWYSLLLLLLSSDILGFDSVIGIAVAPAVPAVAPSFFALLYPLFPHVAVRAAPCGLTRHFSACCGYDCFLFCFFVFFRSSSAFSACCGYGCSFLSPSAFQSAVTLAAHSSLHPRFPHPAPLAALSLWRASCCLPCCRFSIHSSSVVRVLLSLRFCLFSIAGVSPIASFIIALFLRLHSLTWCLLLLVLVCGVLRYDFGSSSASLPCSV